MMSPPSSSTSSSFVPQIRASLRRLTSASSSTATKIDAVESMLNLRGPVHRASDETPEEEENERGEENIDNSPIPWAIDILSLIHI